MAMSLTGWIIVGFSCIVEAVYISVSSHRRSLREFYNSRNLKVIAHRGASGYVPEHTLGAYALAITTGADYIEPDIVSSKDGILIARHDNELGLTTDVSQHPKFADRFKTLSVDGILKSDWFVEDFTLAELKTLRAIERIPNIRPGNARMNGAYEIPTLQEIITLVKGMNNSANRSIGICLEIKHSTHFKRLNLSMEEKIVHILHNNDYVGKNTPIYIQSLEVQNLKDLKKITDLNLLQVFKRHKKKQPFDAQEAGSSLTYGEMATAEGLKKVAEYAYAAAPHKNYIIPRDASNRLGQPTDFIKNAHAAGLKVHPYTFRAENIYLPAEFRSPNGTDTAIGDFAGEIKKYLEAGIDGLFSDQPDVPVRLRQGQL